MIYKDTQIMFKVGNKEKELMEARAKETERDLSKYIRDLIHLDIREKYLKERIF